MVQTAESRLRDNGKTTTGTEQTSDRSPKEPNDSEHGADIAGIQGVGAGRKFLILKPSRVLARDRDTFRFSTKGWSRSFFTASEIAKSAVPSIWDLGGSREFEMKIPG
jgi:hypothetical protein